MKNLNENSPNHPHTIIGEILPRGAFLDKYIVFRCYLQLFNCSQIGEDIVQLSTFRLGSSFI